MRSLRLGLLILVLAGCGLLAWFVSTPVERQRARVEAALQSARTRHESARSTLKDPEQNGLLEPELRSFWDRSLAQETALAQAGSRWAQAYSFAFYGQRVAHQAMLSAQDAAYLEARQAFGNQVPALVKGLSRPHFAPPNEDYANPLYALDEQSLSHCVAGLSALGESLLAEGAIDSAALVYEVAFRLAFRVTEAGGSLVMAQGMAMQAIPFQSLVWDLSPAIPLSPDHWRGLSRALLESTPTRAVLQRAIEDDLAFGVTFLQAPRGSYDGDARHLRGAYLIPGLRGRDLRTYRNLMGQVLEQAAAGTVTVALPSPERSAMLGGSSGPGTLLLAPDYASLSARWSIHQAKLHGLALSAGLCAFRRQNGHYPESLDQLDSLQLLGPENQPWSRQPGISYQRQGDQAHLQFALGEALFRQAKLDPETAQQQVGENPWGFRITAEGMLWTLKQP